MRISIGRNHSDEAELIDREIKYDFSVSDQPGLSNESTEDDHSVSR